MKLLCPGQFSELWPGRRYIIFLCGPVCSLLECVVSTEMPFTKKPLTYVMYHTKDLLACRSLLWHDTGLQGGGCFPDRERIGAQRSGAGIRVLLRLDSPLLRWR